jgi:lipopolysaccharide export system protein LptA
VNKLILFFLFLGFSQTLLAQKVTRIELIQSENFIGLQRNGVNTNKVIKPIFRQDNATLTCDSAYFYLAKNSFEAFGNVHINQADTLNIYADNLNYDGNTKLAILKNNVKLTDNDAVLTTNDLDYNMATKIGRYYNGGKIVNGKNTLTSQNGYYFTNSKDAYFRYQVKVKSDDVLIKSDTLKYNTVSKIAYFFGPTDIYGKTDTLYTENGQYNTTNDKASFGKNNLYRQNSKSLKGDSLFYDGKAGYGRAVKRIIFIDTAQKIELRGDLGIYRKADESIMVTKNAYTILVTEKDSVTKDSVWLTADTLKSKVLTKMQLYALQNAAKTTKDSLVSVTAITKDSLATDGLKTDSLKTDSLNIDSVKIKTVIKKPIKKEKKEPLKPVKPAAIAVSIVKKAPDRPIIWPQIKISDKRKLGLTLIRPKSTIIPIISLDKEASDTTKIRVIFAYNKVKIFKSDLQAKADSAFFSYGDSTLRIYRKPLLWAQGSQLSADTMYIQMKNKKMDNMDLIRNAIIVNTEKDSVKFNQIAGKLMKGYFRKEKLDVVFVNGNAESIYFPTDSASNDGMMRSIASRMRINFTNDSLSSVAFIRKPEHTYYPVDKITEELKTLPNFNWKPKERPISKEDIIPSLKAIVPTDKKAKPKQVTKPKTTEKPQEVKSFFNDLKKEAKPAKEPVEEIIE